jgi:uncharacterized damage-inducible protein DinB
MRVIDPILMELDQEGATTRRLLERIPNDKLEWRPHEKARTLGQLAAHIAGVQPGVASLLQNPTADVTKIPPDQAATSAEDVVSSFDTGLAAAKQTLGAMTDEDLMSNWSLVNDGKPIFTAPKIGVVRMIVLNHIYHHRGQLSTYLRALGVAVPSIYGPSADENPFM